MSRKSDSKKLKSKKEITPVKPPENGAVFHIQTSRETSVSFSGPLPPPEILGAYNKVVPGCAERLISMVELQSEHRRSLEARVVNSNTRNQTIGLLLAFVLSLVVIGAGALLINNDKNIEGLGLIIGDLVLLAGVFVYGRKSQEKERLEKRKKFPS